MAKGRMLNREVGMSMKFQELQSDTVRLFATWTIAHLDKNGVFYGDPQSVRSAVFPMREDITNADVYAILADMERVGLIVRFQSGGRTWQAWPGFTHNQTYLRKDLENTSFPHPPNTSEAPAETLRKSSVDIIGGIPPNGIERNGIETNMRASGATGHTPQEQATPILGFAQIAHKEADVPFSENSLDQFQTMMGRKDKLWSERMKAPEAIRDIAVSVSQALGIVPTKSQLPFWAKGAAELYEVLAGDPALIGAAVADMRGKGLSMSSPKSLVTTVQRLKAAPAASISQGTDFQRAQRAALEAELRGAA